ncbi:hypothetical protein [Aquimarina litoralis]|uniref:hypothetical protein n=1 Tax=Aquimarina litoralis TaxID=584605 RepID=UPI001C56E2CC|nr:hypothetical protein [Aquimarina litoralis]MBW1296925.1 hypothetical protein [Aquimarina litoralis]
MSDLRKCFLMMMLGCLLLTISCQEEEQEIIDPTIDNTIPQSSQLVGLMKNIVTHDGSFDDIVDGGNCFSINLPYMIIRNSEPLVINKIEDYNQLQVSDNIQIQFPITITRDDHVSEIIENDAALRNLADTCQIEDEDIECVDFVYPFRFATYDSNNNIIGTTEVFHDAQVFGFMGNLNANTVVAINYPIRLLLSNGEFLDIAHNTDLLSGILAFQASCEENDG